MVAPRVLVYSNQDEPLFELDPSHLHEMRTVETVNGEHSLTVTTTQRLEKTQRLLTVDESGKAREYVVTGVDEEHQGGRRLVGTYYAVWSLQYDLSGTYTTAFPGYDNEGGVSAAVALGMLLENTSRWSVGTVTQTTSGMASFYYLSGWKALSELVNTWGGEVDAVITVDNRGVASRQVCLHAHQGSTVAIRRFDYGADLTGIRRKVADDIVTPRIVPLGKSQGANGVRLGIADVNDGIPYLQDDGSAALYRVPNGSGGWEYPTQVIVNDGAEWPEQLLEWAEEVKEQYTRPKVTYEASVAQLVAAGMDAHGLALGDESQVVDGAFGDEGLRISGRVVKLEIDELDYSNTVVTLGYLSDGLSSVLGDLASKVSAVEGGLGYMSTAQYLDELLSRINAEVNATGGYAYIVPGQGVITYDREVSDPLVGAEASQVVQMKGGSIRIASAKKAAFAGINDWEWRSVFVSGLVATDVLTATNIVTGIIEDAQNKSKPGTGNYWNLDTGELRMSAKATVDGKTVDEIASGAASDALSSANGYTDSAKKAIEQWRTQENIFNTLTNNGETQGIYLSDGLVYINGTYIKSGVVDAALVKAGVLTDEAGKNHWNMKTGEFALSATTTVGGKTVDEIASGAASGAETAANSHTDGVEKALKDWRTQENILNALTDDGKAQGIWLADGQLYVNGSYIRAAGIDAGYITAGVLTDKTGANSWNMETGDLSITGTFTSSRYIAASGTIAARNSVMALSGGKLEARAEVSGTAHSGYLDASAAVDTGLGMRPVRYGPVLHGDEAAFVDAPYHFVGDGGGTWRRCSGAKRKLVKASALSLADNLLSATLETETVETAHGSEVALEGAPPVESSVTCSGDSRLATKKYVDDAIPSLSGYATQKWVEGKNYLTGVPSGYATQAWVSNQGFSKAAFNLSGTTLTITT